MKQAKHISILVPAGDAILSSIIGTFKTFNAANQYLIQSGKTKSPLFDVQLVGISDETNLYNGAFAVRPHTTIDKIRKTDLIIIPALSGDIPAEIARNSAYIPWIITQHQQGAEVASLCTGAFVLASTGLLNGRKCTTHWIAAEKFRAAFPDVELVPEKILTDESGIYTSGGAYSFLNLILYLVEKFSGRDVALYCSKLMEIDMDRHSQLHFSLFTGQKEHQDTVVKNAQIHIEKNYADRITVDHLAEKFNISRRNLERRFRKACGSSPIEYIQRVKIEAAKKSLESTGDNINEVMYGVGYNDSKAFRAIFKKNTGLSPIQYKQKYNREMAV